MIPKRETPEAIEERSTGNTRHPRLSGSVMGKRNVFGIVILVSYILMVNIVSFYQAKLVTEMAPSAQRSGSTGIWGGFWAIPILTGAWLIATILRVLRKRQP